MSTFFQRMVTWQLLHGRKGLPWQNQEDPYKIWLSEVMLQQTQVYTVIDYYNRFLLHFPSVRALAEAEVDDVLRLWAGLGYYARARNLHACAQKVVRDFDGQFPSEVAQLQTLPGIGRSTASAIAAFGFGARVSILDAHAKRIVARYEGLNPETFLSKSQWEKTLWQHAEALVQEDATHAEMIAYTQGLMDLGSLHCVPKVEKLTCGQCPIQGSCRYEKQLSESPQVVPIRTEKKPKPEVHKHFFLMLSGDTIVLEKRLPKGIWGGLYSLPEVGAEAYQEYMLHHKIQVLQTTPLFKIKHAFTHFMLYADVWLCQYSPTVLSDKKNHIKISELDSIGLPAPIKKMLNNPVVRATILPYL